MASEGKEKKRKATSLPNDIPQKPSKKSKKSLERGKESAISVPAEEAVTNNGSEKAFKSKHKPRKRAADFLSDSEDNAAHGASASAPPEGNAEPASKPKEKKSKKVAGTDQPSSNTKEILSPVNMPTEVGKSKERKSAPPPSDSAKKSSDVPRAKPPQQQGHPAASSRATNQGDHDTSTSLPAPSKKPKKNKKPKGQALVDAESLTADGVNGVVEDQGDAALNPITNKEPTSMSMQAEGQETVEKELEDEWASEDDEDDQGAALLAGFDSDGEDTAVDEGLERDKPLPQISKEVSKKVKKAGQKGGNDGPGVVYVGRIPHGFYEHQMREYFSQFGTISKLRLARNRRTGASKHFAFIEFESDEVAKIVANTMDNYLMFGHILKCKYAPQENLHPDLWKGANKRFKRVPYTMLEKKALEAPKTAEQWERKNAKEQKKREQKAAKMKSLGYEMKLPKLKDPAEVLERRKLLKATQESQGSPAGAIEPPNNLPKDEFAMQAEKKPKKKDKPAKQPPMESLAEVTAATQLAEAVAEKPRSETGKRDKRKEKKAKAKDAKADQVQLDAQLVGDPEASIEATKAKTKSVTYTTAEAESSSDKKGNGDATTAKPLAHGKEKKRKRRKSNELKAAGAETTTAPLTSHASRAGSLEKPKQKKRKSEGNV